MVCAWPASAANCLAMESHNDNKPMLPPSNANNPRIARPSAGLLSLPRQLYTSCSAPTALLLIIPCSPFCHQWKRSRRRRKRPEHLRLPPVLIRHHPYLIVASSSPSLKRLPPWKIALPLMAGISCVNQSRCCLSEASLFLISCSPATSSAFTLRSWASGLLPIANARSRNCISSNIGKISCLSFPLKLSQHSRALQHIFLSPGIQISYPSPSFCRSCAIATTTLLNA